METLPSPDSRSSRIFVVDDEWMIAESLAALLQKNGFRASAFHNPVHALARAIDCSPDILITDVLMPGMTGVELALSLRRAGSDTRILLVSGQPSAAGLLLQDAQREGYDFELLDKPLHPMQLLLRLRHLRRRSPRTHAASAETTPLLRPRPAA